MTSFLSVYVICVTTLLGTVTPHTDYDFPNYSQHPCLRTCDNATTGRVCEYHFLVETFYVLSTACWDCPSNSSHCFRPHCVAANGVKRTIMAVNRQLPGPAIEVCLGDKIVVTIDNRLEMHEGTSIHWHGITNRKYPHMDGVAMVTQCPIPALTQFTYSFSADDVGTHFWHAHSGLQRTDGIAGALIVRAPSVLDPSRPLYDHDLPEHVIVISDWVNIMASDWYSKQSHAGGPFLPSDILINGLGPDNVDHFPQTPKATFKVKAGEKYRFRVIFSGSFDCEAQMSIDSHTMMVIASDGNTVEPMVVDAFNIVPGERFDFVLYADKISLPLRKYWIRVQAIGCPTTQLSQTAILEYEGTTDLVPGGNTTFADGLRHGIHLNLVNAEMTPTALAVTQMQSADPDEDTITSTPDWKIYLSLDFTKVDNPRKNHPTYYPFDKVPRALAKYTTQINNISGILPSLPPLSQYQDVPQSAYCNADTIQKACAVEFCECVHQYELGLGHLVELIMFNAATLFKYGHTMHLHGVKFRVMALVKLNGSTTVDEMKALDQQGQVPRLTTKAPLKDTVIVPGGFATVVRFRADNPGVWVLHCHMQDHNLMGLGLLFQVGTQAQMPRAPTDFPKCGSWRFHGYQDDDDDDDEDGDDDGGNKGGDGSDIRCVVTVNSNTASAAPKSVMPVCRDAWNRGWLAVAILACVALGARLT